MIRLTRTDGLSIYVPEDIVIKERIAYSSEKGGEVSHAYVVYHGCEYGVKESPEEVARKVLEWRLAMERYRAVVFAEAKETGEEAKMLAWARDVEYKIVLNLAGLEEPKNEHS